MGDDARARGQAGRSYRAAATPGRMAAPQKCWYPRIQVCVVLMGRTLMRCKPSALVLALVLTGCSQAHYSNRLPPGYQTQLIAGRAALQEGDVERGAELLAGAAQSGHPYAEIEYARVLAFGEGIEKDRAEAIRLLESAYAKSSRRKADAAFYLGRLLSDDQPARALELLLYARANGRPGAEYEIGTLLAERGDMAEAETYWREAAAAGDLEAQETLAGLYRERGQHAQAQAYGAQALAQYRARADQGDIGAMRRLARAYEEGADPEAYWYWVERAAEAGDVVSQAALARAYLEGRDRPVDGPRGQHWAERAIAQGDAPAKAYLGRALLEGEVLPPDLERAETLLEEAAEAGHSAAQTDLGRAYLTGSPLSRDPEAGLRWLEAAIAQGSSSAMTALGYAYWNGDGVPQDRAKAEELLRRAADLGHPSARRFMERRA
jgi:TPR repeat protein